ncbi:MAG: glycosyltransferase [Lachnospiraceae bacterium]|nr:glycosyltransferase [Lachnospiraceae bacterium]
MDKKNQVLSVCIITKNESKKLEKCLQTLKAYPFEIVIVDTGSTDDTKQMAKAYTSAIYDFDWCDDFAAAKNFAIRKAGNDRIMILDSDEYLSEIDVKGLLRMLEQCPEQVGRICRHNVLTRDGQRIENVEYINRIFSRELFHYEGRIHEQVVALSKKEYETYLAPVTIIHTGYDGTEEERNKKAQRNIELLLKEREENFKDTYILYQLGKSYYMAGSYVQAIQYFELALGYDLNPKLEYVIDMVETYGYALLKVGQVETALLLENIYQEFGDSADFKFLMGLIYMNNERFDDAVTEFEKAAEYKTSRMVGVNSYLAYYNAGIIRECLGDVDAARSYYEKCGKYERAVERLTCINKQNTEE